MPDATSRWPDGSRAAISITLDNMGEAAAIGRGTWRPNRKTGNDKSVRQTLPKMLELLDAENVRATYFVEGWSVDDYGDVIGDLAERGHDVGYHGWVHEQWSTLEPDDEAEILAHGVQAFQSLGIRPRGFRPPGGVLTDSTISLLQDNGFDYCSPAGNDAAVVDGVTILPFRWQGIDAYYYAEAFASLRRQKRDRERVLGPDQFVQGALTIVNEVVRAGGYVALLFHPHLEMDPERFAAMSRIVEHVARRDDVWRPTCAEASAWVQSHPDQFTGNPRLDRSTWSR